MSQRRRGLVLLGLALVLGGLAASDVARRERALERRLGPAVTVAVARADLPPGHRLRPRDLAERTLPARYVPADAAGRAEEVAGARLVAGLPAGGYLTAAHVAAAGALAGPAVRPGERAVEIVAAGPPRLVIPGARVDVLVTRERGGTVLALQDVEVLAARRPRAGEAAAAGTEGARVAATLRVRLRQAVFLTAAQSFAREIRLLPRAAGDRGRAAGLRVGEGL